VKVKQAVMIKHLVVCSPTIRQTRLMVKLLTRTGWVVLIPPRISSFLFIQQNAPLDYSRLKLTLKCSYMFWLTNHHQGAYCCTLLKL